MKKAEHRQVQAICSYAFALAKVTKGTSNTEVLQRTLVHLRSALRRGQIWLAEDLVYRVLMECQNLSEEGSDEDTADECETSKTPYKSVNSTVNIGRSIKFVRVAAGIRQGEMAQRLGISQNYLSLLENNKAEPSMSLLKKISTEFKVPVSFLLLESSVEFESGDPDKDLIWKQLHKLIHQLQSTRIKESQESMDGSDELDD